MTVNGTLINYYFHCKRQCYLHGNRLNLEDNSETVKIGKAVHEEREEKAKNAELQIENIKIDALTDKYLVEIKKSDADVEASQWKLLLYLKILKEKGIERIGKLEFVEKNKQKKNVILVELTEEKEQKLEQYIAQITDLINGDEIPPVQNKTSCKSCAYYEYCYV